MSDASRQRKLVVLDLTESFEEELWRTVATLGDRDTTCAIVGGIVALRVGWEGIPSAWRAAREPLPEGFW